MKNIISILLSFLGGMAVDRVSLKKKHDEQLKYERLRGDKLQEFYELLLLWLELRQRNSSLKKYFDNKEYRNVAIYGMKEIGEALYRELNSIGIEIKYLIDKDANSIYSDKDVYMPNDNLPDVDLIIVTALHYYDEITSELSVKVNCPIVNLTDVIYETLTLNIEKTV